MASPTIVLATLLDKGAPVTTEDTKVVAFVSAFASQAMALKDKPYSNWKELAAYAKENPGAVTAGGSLVNMLAIASIADQAGIELTYVPYDGTGKAMNDFLGGHVDLGVTPAGIAVDYTDRVNVLIDAGDFEQSPETLASLGNPDTASSLGYEGFSAPRWIGVHKDTPDEIVNKISENMGKLLEDKAIAKLLAKIGEDVAFVPAADAQKKFNAMVAKAKKLAPLLDK